MDFGQTSQMTIFAKGGFRDVMSSADAVRFVSRQFKKGASTQDVTNALVDLAIKRYSTDNVAAIVIHLQQPSGKNNTPAS